MNTKSSRLLTTNIIVTAVAATMLSILAGCGKPDAPKAVVEIDETLPASSAPAPAPAVATAKAATATSAPSLASLPPLHPDIIAMIETNKSSVVEHQIYYISNADITPVEKAQALFMVYSSLDRPGQRKVAHAAVKYVEDENFVLIREQLLDAKLHPQVLSVFMTDTLKRGNSIKLPVLYDLARYEGHPMQEEARQLLGHYCGKDYGSNWDKWEQAMLAFLDENPN